MCQTSQTSTVCCLFLNNASARNAADARENPCVNLAPKPLKSWADRQAKAPETASINTDGLENLTRLSANEADLGLVQVDTLKKMVPTDSQIGELQLVLPMHNNLLHVLALRKGSKLPKKVGGIAIPGLYSTMRLQRVSN